jgi:tryptophan-rich sensory protein
MTSKSINILKFIVSIVIPLGLGSVAGLVTSEAIPEWYASLNRPSFSPPNWLFGPVWTSIYILLGISLFLVWKQPSGSDRNKALFIFAVQMALNFGWTFIFFYFKMLQLALIEIVILWFSILFMMFWFYNLWVTFAAILTARYYYLNA